MKRIAWFLLPLLLFLAACGSGATNSFEPSGVEEPGQETAATTAPTAVTAADATSAPAADDPTVVRERDWKQGNTVDPAVTIIEYGDFQ